MMCLPRSLLLSAALLAACLELTACGPLPSVAPSTTSGGSVVRPYRPRPGHERPVVAVVGHNAGTELIDFVAPYSILRRSGVADVVSVSTSAGAMNMQPALSLQAEATIDEFDAAHPQAADYVVVPAVLEDHRADPRLLQWLRAQSARGAIIVSICDGALPVAEAGLLKGHRATGHWATQSLRESRFADTQWQKNVRYVDDGAVISSAGVSAAVPLSLALVEAIGGRERASEVARDLGTDRWDDTHASEGFRLRAQDVAVYVRNRWLASDEVVEVPVADGVDELSLAFAVDALGRSMRTRVTTNANAAVVSKGGLKILPARTVAASPVAWKVADKPLPTLDQTLARIGQRYGDATADFVRLQLEYPKP